MVNVARNNPGVKDLAEVVRYHRKKSGLTQSELARLAGVGKTVVFDVEKGKKTLQLDTLSKILHVLNIQIEFGSPLISSFLRETNEKI